MAWIFVVLPLIAIAIGLITLSRYARRQEAELRKEGVTRWDPRSVIDAKTWQKKLRLTLFSPEIRFIEVLGTHLAAAVIAFVVLAIGAGVAVWVIRIW